MNVRAAVVGLGWMGRNLADILDDLDGTSLVAAADVDADARSSFEAAFERPAVASLDDLFGETRLDAAVVATPHALHHDHAVAAIEAGLDVLVEKPMVTSVEEARSLVATARDHDATVQVGYYRSFHPAFRELRRLVEDGRIGSPRMAACHLGQSWLETNADSWRTDPDLAVGGQLSDGGAHLLDGLCWCLDAAPERVAAVADPRGEAVDVNSALAATLDAGGERVVASIGVSGESTALSPDEMLTVWGTAGRLTYRHDEERAGTRPAHHVEVVAGDRTYETTVELDDPFVVTRRKLRAFAAAVEGERPSPVPATYGARLTAFREAARCAWNEGRTVEVADPVDGTDATGTATAGTATAGSDDPAGEG